MCQVSAQSKTDKEPTTARPISDILRCPWVQIQSKCIRYRGTDSWSNKKTAFVDESVKRLWAIKRYSNSRYGTFQPTPTPHSTVGRYLLCFLRYTRAKKSKHRTKNKSYMKILIIGDYKKIWNHTKIVFGAPSVLPPFFPNPVSSSSSTCPSRDLILFRLFQQGWGDLYL